MIKFVGSFETVKSLPNSHFAEYAFIGRSNVGKSSLINAVVGAPIARTSNTPGRTQSLNLFNLDDRVMIVDLPGYGYARASKEQRRKLRGIIDGYILFRPQLTNLFVLIDCRHEPQQIDVEFMRWLGESGIPFSIVFTKADKLSHSRLMSNIENYKNELLKEWEALPPMFITSSEKAQGRDELLDYIEEIIKQVDEEEKTL